MNHEMMLEIGEKIKNQTATQEEIDMFLKGFADLTEDVKHELKN